jgi:hypothetical protein
MTCLILQILHGYISSKAGGIPGTQGFQWQYQVEQRYDPRVAPENRFFVIGGQNSQYFQEGGRYTIGMRIRFENPKQSQEYIYCPPTNQLAIYKGDYVIVRSEGKCRRHLLMRST